MVNIKDLKGQLLVEGLNDEDMKKLASVIEVVKVKKGDPIFKEDDQTKGIYMVKKGVVEINKMTPDGWKQKLAQLKENHFFGELSIIEHKKTHGANADALDNVELFVIDKEQFEKIEENDPALISKIMRTIAKVASRNVHLMNDKLIKLLISY